MVVLKAYFTFTVMVTSTESSVRIDAYGCGVGKGLEGIRGSPQIHRTNLRKRRGQAPFTARDVCRKAIQNQIGKGLKD